MATQTRSPEELEAFIHLLEGEIQGLEEAKDAVLDLRSNLDREYLLEDIDKSIAEIRSNLASLREEYAEALESEVSSPGPSTGGRQGLPYHTLERALEQERHVRSGLAVTLEREIAVNDDLKRRLARLEAELRRRKDGSSAWRLRKRSKYSRSKSATKRKTSNRSARKGRHSKSKRRRPLRGLSRRSRR